MPALLSHQSYETISTSVAENIKVNVSIQLLLLWKVTSVQHELKLSFRIYFASYKYFYRWRKIYEKNTKKIEVPHKWQAIESGIIYSPLSQEQTIESGIIYSPVN